MRAADVAVLAQDGDRAHREQGKRLAERQRPPEPQHGGGADQARGAVHHDERALARVPPGGEAAAPQHYPPASGLRQGDMRTARTPAGTLGGGTRPHTPPGTERAWAKETD